MATSSGTLGGAQRHPATIILLAVAALAVLAAVISFASGGGNGTSPLNSGGTRLAGMSCEEMVEANNADQLPDDLSSREQLSLLDCALQVQIEEAKDAGDEAEVRELQAQRGELSGGFQQEDGLNEEILPQEEPDIIEVNPGESIVVRIPATEEGVWIKINGPSASSSTNESGPLEWSLDGKEWVRIHSGLMPFETVAVRSLGQEILMRVSVP